MRIIFYIFTLLASQLALSQEEINCGDGQCMSTGGITEDSKINFTSFTILEARTSTQDININSNIDEDKQDLKIYLETSNLSGSNLSINLNSKSKGEDGSSAIFITNNINSANLNLNGKSGESVGELSYLCATKIKNGDFGSDVLSNFNSYRSSNPTTPNDQCVLNDLEFMQNKPHSCEPNFSPLSGNIEATRWKGYLECRGHSARKMCVRKRQSIRCEWNASKIDSCCDTENSPQSNNWNCDISRCNLTDNGWYKTFQISYWEDEVDDLTTQYGSLENACDSLFTRSSNNINTLKTRNDWRGSFSGSWREENMDFSYTTAERNIYKIEFKVGTGVECSNSSSCLNKSDLNIFYNSYEELDSNLLWQYINPLDSDYQVLSHHSRFSCRLPSGLYNGILECYLNDQGTDEDSYTPTRRMRKTIAFSFRFKIHYIDKYGQNQTEETTYKLGHY